jgi:nucleotide-binding universal stress UspA family protein
VICMRLSRQHDLITSSASARPLERIVVGIDFSEVSLAAARWVGRHLARDATLTLVHVIAPPPLPNVARLWSGPVPDPERRLRARIQSMGGALRGLAGVIGAPGTTVEVRVGDAAVQLPAYANMVDADLLVVGGNPVIRASRRPEIATTNRLLRQLARPGLVARSVQSSLSTVLVALTDAAPSSVSAAARMVAAPSGARVVALRVADSEPTSEASVSAAPRDAAGNAENARMIADAARDLRADVIVIGSQAPATDGDDVARVLARTADCSVLVVPQAAGPVADRRLDRDVPGMVTGFRAPGRR